MSGYTIVHPFRDFISGRLIQFNYIKVLTILNEWAYLQESICWVNDWSVQKLIVEYDESEGDVRKESV